MQRTIYTSAVAKIAAAAAVFLMAAMFVLPAQADYASLNFSQNNPSMTTGQSLSVSVYSNNGYNSTYYISQNSNSSAVTASISGTVVNLYAQNSGNASIVVCQNTYNMCGTIYVTVNGYNNGGGGYGSLTFSQSSVSMTTGQSQSVSIYSNNGIYNYGSYYISSNSNPGIVSASISGSVVNLFANNTGSSSISICQSSLNNCGTLYVSVNGNGGIGGNGTITFSNTNPNLSVGQSLSVSMYDNNGNNYGSYYISQNSNPNAVSASLSGSVLNLYGLTYGTSSIDVCDNYNDCGTLFVNVGSNGGGGIITFSQTSPLISIGQTLSVSITASNTYNNFNNGFYISQNSNPNVASASVSGSLLSVYGMSYGTTTIGVCQSGNINICGTLFVNVSASGSGGSGILTFSQSNPALTVGQSLTVSVYSNNAYYGSYYITSNSNASAVNANTSGNTLNLYAQNIGSSSIVICQTNTNICGTMFVTVNSNTGINNGNITFSTTNPSLYIGQSLGVNIYSSNGIYSSGSYYLSQNSNPNIVTATVTGSVLNLYAQSYGSTSLNVCQSGYNNCGTIYVTVNGGIGTGGSGVGSVSFSQSAPTLTLGQTLGVNLYTNGSTYAYGAYYVSQNTNSSAVSAVITGTIMNVTAMNYGTSAITVCQNSGASCGTMTVTVTANGGISSLLSFNPPSLSVGIGQSNTTSAYSSNNAGSFYISQNTAPNIATATVSGSVITATGISAGTDAITVCQNTGSLCGTVTVTVGGGSGSGSGSVLGTSTYISGTLIKESSGAIFIVYNNTKTGFTNFAAFQGLGFQTANVLYVGSDNLTDSGHVVSTALAAHPWGSWIKNGSTIYFVSSSGLVPISSYAIFTANGGNPNWVVPANSYDLSLPILGVMTYNDPRV